MNERKRIVQTLCICVFCIVLSASTQTNENRALHHYERFLQGEESANDGQETIDIDFITKPTGEPDKHYSSEYVFWDSDRDGIPELHVRSARYYFIIKYQNGELEVWKELSRNYDLLNNGALLETYEFSVPRYETYTYVIAAPDGSDAWKLQFSTFDANCNYTHDEYDEYYFAGIQVTKEQWEALAERYLTIESAEWITIYEETD